MGCGRSTLTQARAGGLDPKNVAYMTFTAANKSIDERNILIFVQLEMWRPCSASRPAPDQSRIMKERRRPPSKILKHSLTSSSRVISTSEFSARAWTFATHTQDPSFLDRMAARNGSWDGRIMAFPIGGEDKESMERSSSIIDCRAELNLSSRSDGMGR